MTGLVFAARLDGWIHIIVLLVVGGIALINRITERRRHRAEQAPATRPAPRRGQEQANMDSKDIDQFLDEVLAGRRARAPRPEEAVPEAEVVVLRPNRPPARQPVRQPPRARQPAPRRAPPPPAVSGGPPPLITTSVPATTDFRADVKRAFDQAAHAASGAGALQPSTQQVERVAPAVPAVAIAASLRTPADVRRAFLLAELFGPPRAFRKLRRI